VQTIENGFDPDDFRGAQEPLTNNFSITYTGQLYEGRRDPTPLFEVLSQLLAEKALAAADVRVRFYGPVEAWLPQQVARYRLGDVVEIHGVVPRGEALRHQAESQVLLLLGWSDTREDGQHTGKLFEYFGAARPVLAVGGARGVLSETLQNTRTGVHALSREQVRAFLLSAY